MGKKLLRESNVKFLQHNVRGLQKAEYQEECIAWVRELNGYAACLQETWMLGDTDEELHKYVILNHGPPAKLCRRGSLGVVIALSPPPRCASVGQRRERATTLRLAHHRSALAH